MAEMSLSLLLMAEIPFPNNHRFGMVLKPYKEWDKLTCHLNWLRLVVFPIIYRVSYIPGGCLGFQPSTVGCPKKLGSKWLG